MAGLEIELTRVEEIILHVTRVVHTSLTPGPFRERHAFAFFVNIVKRTHQVWSWNTMLGPILKHHAMGVVTDSKPATFFLLRNSAPDSIAFSSRFSDKLNTFYIFRRKKAYDEVSQSNTERGRSSQQRSL